MGMLLYGSRTAHPSSLSILSKLNNTHGWSQLWEFLICCDWALMWAKLVQIFQFIFSFCRACLSLPLFNLFVRHSWRVFSKGSCYRRLLPCWDWCVFLRRGKQSIFHVCWWTTDGRWQECTFLYQRLLRTLPYRCFSWKMKWRTCILWGIFIQLVLRFVWLLKCCWLWWTPYPFRWLQR